MAVTKTGIVVIAESERILWSFSRQSVASLPTMGFPLGNFARDAWLNYR